MTNVNFRTATFKDIPRIVELLYDDHLGKTHERPGEPLAQEYKKAFGEIQKTQNTHLILLELNHKIIGFVELSFTPHISIFGCKRAQISGMRIDSEYRSKGYGKQLVDFCIAEAKAADCKKITLITNTDRPDAHRFYQAQGFSPTHVGMTMNI